MTRTRIITAISAVLFSATAAMAQDAPKVTEGATIVVPKNHVAVTDGDGNIVVKKKSFAQLHPKLHKTGRKVRRTCQVLQPVVSFGGSCAQVMQLFKH